MEYSLHSRGIKYLETAIMYDASALAYFPSDHAVWLTYKGNACDNYLGDTGFDS
jgi:hypothetical protein